MPSLNALVQTVSDLPANVPAAWETDEDGQVRLYIREGTPADLMRLLKGYAVIT